MLKMFPLSIAHPKITGTCVSQYAVGMELRGDNNQTSYPADGPTCGAGTKPTCFLSTNMSMTTETHCEVKAIVWYVEVRVRYMRFEKIKTLFYSMHASVIAAAKCKHTKFF